MDLVRYPKMLAPTSGSTTVTVQCADNAHQVSDSLIALCTLDGSWSGTNTLRCECDKGYQITNIDGKQICKG